MAEQLNYQINVGGNASESIGSLKKQLREAQNEVVALSDKFGATSEQAVLAAKRAAELKDRIGDAKALTDAFNPDQKFRALSASLSGVAGGFAALQGAIGLFGAESQQLEKQLLKVQSALALSQGLEAIGNSIDSFKNLKTVAADAFKAIRAGIGSTGIGLLVVALGTIVAYWDDIKGAISGVTEEQKNLNAQSQKNLEAQQEKLSAIDGQSNQLKLQGKSEKEILQLKLKQTDEAIKAAEVNLQNAKNTKNAQVEVTKRNYEITKGLLNFLSLPITSILAAADALGQALGKNWNLREQFTGGVAKLLFDPAEVAAEGDKAIKEAENVLNGLKEKRAGAELQIRDINKQANANSKKNAEERAKLEAEADAVIAEVRKQKLSERQQEELEALAKLNERKKKLEAAGRKDFKEVEEAYRLDLESISQKYNNRGVDTTVAFYNRVLEAVKAFQKKKEEAEKVDFERGLETQSINAITIQDRRLAELAALENEYKQKEELAKKNFESLEALTKLYKAKENAINKKFNEEQAKDDEAKKLMKIKNLNDTASLLGQLSGLFGQQTAANKAFTLAQIGVDTASAISSLTAKSEQNPANGVTFGAAGAIQFATGLIRILANIKKAKDLLFSSSKTSIPTVSASAPSTGIAPVIPQQPQAITTNISQASINALGNSALKAYVLETDVTTNQRRMAAIRQRARFG